MNLRPYQHWPKLCIIEIIVYYNRNHRLILQINDKEQTTWNKKSWLTTVETMKQRPEQVNKQLNSLTVWRYTIIAIQ
jgi:hypothetical protein